MVSKIVVFTALLSYFSMFAHAVNYTDGSANGSILNVVIKGCENTPTCSLKIGTNVTVTVGLVSNVVSDVLKEVVTVVDGLLGSVLGTVGSVVGTVDSVLGTLLGNCNPCIGSGITCPLQIGETYNYTTILPITSLVPKVGVVLVLKLQDGKGNNIICAKIPVEIVA